MKSRAALVAPFLARRIWNRTPFRAELVECTGCGFAFYNPRLEPEEEQRLYAGYRNGEYQRTRHLFEPYYTEAFNADLFSEETMRRRQDALKRLLSPHLSNVDVRSILDFGGGRGQLISDLIPCAARYVYDISEADPIAGSCKLKSLAECRSHEYGLIICSNVLEHIAFPRDIMRDIAGIASPGTLIYLEVPHEHPFSLRAKLQRLIDQLSLLARRPRVAVSLAGVGMWHVMHEHVNFFSRAALGQLASSTGLKIQASGVYSADAEMLWTLAQP